MMRNSNKTIRYTKVITGEVQLAHARLFEPASSFGAEPKFSAVIMIPKADIITIRALRAAQLSALGNAREKFGRPIPPDWKETLRDGDVERTFEYAGHHFMTVASPTPPGIVDRSNKPVFDTTALPSGSFARVSLNAYTYKLNGIIGVAFALNHVQKLRDKESTP